MSSFFIVYLILGILLFTCSAICVCSFLIARQRNLQNKCGKNFKLLDKYEIQSNKELLLVEVCGCPMLLSNAGNNINYLTSLSKETKIINSKENNDLSFLTAEEPDEIGEVLEQIVNKAYAPIERLVKSTKQFFEEEEEPQRHTIESVNSVPPKAGQLIQAAKSKKNWLYSSNKNISQ
jgi:flagellar biogenesis protein FliO